MFVKIVKEGKELLIPCYNTEYTEMNESAFVKINSISGEFITERVECNSMNKIYFMNDFGRTIDKKVWK